MLTYQYNPGRLLEIEVSAGTGPTVTAALVGEGVNQRTDVFAPRVGQFRLSPPLPPKLELVLIASGDAATPYLLVTEIRQGTTRKVDIARGVLPTGGRAQHEVLMVPRQSRSRLLPPERGIVRFEDDFWLEELQSAVAIQARRIVLSEASERRVRLSPYAREMLVLPMIEQSVIDGRTVATSEEIASIAQLVEEIERNPDSRDEGRTGVLPRQRSTASVIRALWARFCRIPPFCGPGRNEFPPSREG